jgi:hypothetical protein
MLEVIDTTHPTETNAPRTLVWRLLLQQLIGDSFHRYARLTYTIC